MKAKDLKKALQVASSSGVLALLATRIAGAATSCDEISWLPDVFCGVSGVFDVESIVRMALYLIIVAAIIWALFNIVRAGLEWSGAAEDPEKKKKATQRIINAVIGLVIVVASFTILSLVSNWFGGNLATRIGQPCAGDGDYEGVVGIVKREGTVYKCIDPDTGQELDADLSD